MSLAKIHNSRLQKHVPNAFFLSNPCRIKFCTQEIVFFCQDLLYRMQRSCSMPPLTEETRDPFRAYRCYYSTSNTNSWESIGNNRTSSCRLSMTPMYPPLSPPGLDTVINTES